jgi:hypothetical protein
LVKGAHFITVYYIESKNGADQGKAAPSVGRRFPASLQSQLLSFAVLLPERFRTMLRLRRRLSLFNEQISVRYIAALSRGDLLLKPELYLFRAANPSNYNKIVFVVGFCACRQAGNANYLVDHP